MLVDPAHPAQHDLTHCDPGCLPAPLLADLARIHRIAPLLARFGVLRVMRGGPLDLSSTVKDFPPELQASILAALRSTRHWTTGAAEFCRYDESATDARALQSLDSKPLAVVAADSTWAEQKDGYKLPPGVDGQALDQTLLMLDRDQTKLSLNSELVIVPGATHVSLAAKREHATKVSDAIKHVVEMTRETVKLPDG